jgi:hypothetical protein
MTEAVPFLMKQHRIDGWLRTVDHELTTGRQINSFLLTITPRCGLAIKTETENLALAQDEVGDEELSTFLHPSSHTFLNSHSSRERKKGGEGG